MLLAFALAAASVVPGTAVPGAAAPGLAVPGSVAATIPSAEVRTSVRDVPANDGWVTDLAGLLEPGVERKLEALMESYKRGSGIEIALLTVPDLGGRDIESYAIEVARTWGIGKDGDFRAALLVVAKQDRRMRIEVARGLEGDLTDILCGRIIRDVITPSFRAGEYQVGILQGIEAIHAVAGGDYAPLERTRRGRQAAGAGIGVFLVLFLLVAFFAGRGRSGGGRDGRWFLIWIALDMLMASQRRGGFGGGGFGGGGGGGFSGFGGGGGGFSGGGASGGW